MVLLTLLEKYLVLLEKNKNINIFINNFLWITQIKKVDDYVSSLKKTLNFRKVLL